MDRSHFCAVAVPRNNQPESIRSSFTSMLVKSVRPGWSALLFGEELASVCKGRPSESSRHGNAGENAVMNFFPP